MAKTRQIVKSWIQTKKWWWGTENNVSAKKQSARRHTMLWKRSNKRVAKMKELLLYVKKLEKDLSDQTRNSSRHIQMNLRATTTKIWMQTCSLQRKLVKQVTRTSQLVYSDEHARLSILKVVKHATLPDNINEAGLRMRDYADTLKRAIDGRQ
jgi:hypothetical protein